MKKLEANYLFIETDEKTLDAFKDQVSNLYKKDCSIKTQMQTFVKEQKFEQDKKALDLLRNKSMQTKQEILEILQKQHENERELARNGLLPDQIWNKLNEETEALMKELYEEESCKFLQLEMQRNDHQNLLQKIQKLRQTCEVEMLQHSTLQQEFERKRLQLIFENLKKLEQEMEKKLNQAESGWRNQIVKDFEHDASGLAVVDRCKRGMWNTFKKYLRESQELLKIGNEKKAKALLKQNNNEQQRQKDLLWTKIYEDGRKFIEELEALGFDKIVQDEKKEKDVAEIQEKNRVSLGVVQRFTQLMLQQRRTAREEIKKIKVKKIVEELQNLQSRSDLESLPFSLPYPVQSKTARPAHLVGTTVPEFHEVVVPQPEQRAVSNIRQNNPYSVSLVPSSDDEQFLSDQRSVDSAESVEEQVDSGWFACADGFPLYDRGNGWAQDKKGYWYAYNSITNFWDVYGNPLPPTYEQITERKATRLLQ